MSAPLLREPLRKRQEITTGRHTTLTQVLETTETHEGHDHSHEGHEHHHHQPTLNPELTRSIEVEAPAEDVKKAYDRVIKKIAKQARIPGFRAGKVPAAMIRSKFAREVREEVLDTLVNEKFRNALVDQKLMPISQPQVSELILNEGAPLKFKATFEVLPDVNVDGYDTVTVEKPEITISDDEFQHEMEGVLEHHATVETVDEDRAIKTGDWAEIEFKGEIQALATTVGEEEKAPEAQPITGEDVLIEVGGKNTLQAFNEALNGAKVGQELTFEAAYPAEFGDARLAGKTVKYDVKVKAIKKKVYPEKDEEFAALLGDYSSWQDFEDKLREHSAGRKKDALENQARDQMVEQFIARFQFPVPETFVQQQIDARLERGLRALAQQGMKPEDMRKLDFGRLREAQRDQAVNEVKASLILDKLAEIEGIKVTDDELERELFMASLQAREPIETMKARMTEDGSIERMREQMTREKTGTILYEKLAK